jgi:hypothetical protein
MEVELKRSSVVGWLIATVDKKALFQIREIAHSHVAVKD